MSIADVAVLIVSYRSQKDLKTCLEALSQTSYGHFRVIICENGGRAAFDALKQTLPSALREGQTITIELAPTNLGFAGGINFCFDKAGKADAYWILNPDTEVEAGTLKALVTRLEKGDCEAVGNDLLLNDGRLASRAGGEWQALIARAVSIDHGKKDDGPPDQAEFERRLDYLVGASMLVSAAFLEQCGPMREDYFLYCEEVEWCLRAKRLGLMLGYASNTSVTHHHGTSTGGGGPLKTRSRLSTHLQERNRILLTRDVYPMLLPFTAILSLIHILLRYNRRMAFRQLTYALEGWLAGLRDKRGPPSWLASN